MINSIDGPSGLRSTTPMRRTTKTTSSGKASFSKHLEETEGASGLQAPVSLSSVSGVLDLQEVDDALDREAKGKMRAEEMLEKLDDLRMDLLSGNVSKSKLERLAQIVNTQRAEVTDPHLSQILDEIDLRAQVELAKFTRT